MKVVTFKLPAEYVDALGAKAAASEVSVSQLLRNVVAAEVGFYIFQLSKIDKTSESGVFE